MTGRNNYRFVLLFLNGKIPWGVFNSNRQGTWTTGLCRGLTQSSIKDAIFGRTQIFKVSRIRRLISMMVNRLSAIGNRVQVLARGKDDRGRHPTGAFRFDYEGVSFSSQVNFVRLFKRVRQIVRNTSVNGHAFRRMFNYVGPTLTYRTHVKARLRVQLQGNRYLLSNINKLNRLNLRAYNSNWRHQRGRNFGGVFFRRICVLVIV